MKTNRSFSQSFAFIRQNERVLRLLLNLLLLLLLRLSFPQPIPYARIHSSTPHRHALSSSRELSLKSTFKVFRFQSACALPRLLGSFTGLSPRERVRERRERERKTEKILFSRSSCEQFHIIRHWKRCARGTAGLFPFPLRCRLPPNPLDFPPETAAEAAEVLKRAADGDGEGDCVAPGESLGHSHAQATTPLGLIARDGRSPTDS